MVARLLHICELKNPENSEILHNHGTIQAITLTTPLHDAHDNMHFVLSDLKPQSKAKRQQRVGSCESCMYKTETHSCDFRLLSVIA